MKRSRSVLGAWILAGLLLAFVWASMQSKTQGTTSGLHIQGSPTSTQTAVAQPLVRASNLILIEFFAGY
jgi:hypothetical protein